MRGKKPPTNFFCMQFACQPGYGENGFQLDDKERLQDPRDGGESEHHTGAARTHLLPADGQNRLDWEVAVRSRVG